MIHTADQSARRRSLRLLRRLLTIGLAAVIALVGAWALYPTLRKHYYLGRLAAADLRDVGQAMTALANLATDDASVIRPLWSTLAPRLTGPETDVRDQARYVTSWLVRNVELARPYVESALAIADDPLFFALAESLILAGAWDVRDRTIDHRARLAVIRYRRAEPASRIHVLTTMEEPGPVAAVHFTRILDTAVEDPDPTIRAAALRVSAVMGDPTSITRLVSRLDDASPTVRRAALLWLGQLTPKAYIGDVVMRLDDADPVRDSLLWGARGDEGHNRDPGAGHQAQQYPETDQLIDVGHDAGQPQDQGRAEHRAEDVLLEPVAVSQDAPNGTGHHHEETADAAGDSAPQRGATRVLDAKVLDEERHEGKEEAESHGRRRLCHP